MRLRFQSAAPLAAVLALPGVPALAQPVSTAQFPANATVGRDTRPVTVHFSCALTRGRINNLAIAFDFPDAERLKPGYDTDIIEGPTGKGAKVHMTAGTTQANFAVGGSYGENGLPGTTFTFSVAFSQGPDLRQLQTLVGALVSGPGRTKLLNDAQKRNRVFFDKLNILGNHRTHG